MHQEFPAAPELRDIDAWINSSPLAIADLRGKVIGVEFWTYSCYNCDNAVPHMEKLFRKHGPKGFVLIGVHAPEFESDKNIDSIKDYVLRKQLTFPVAVDNDMSTWEAYGNRYWPTLYLIDKQGRVRSQHIGEGGYHQIEEEVKHLLAE